MSNRLFILLALLCATPALGLGRADHRYAFPCVAQWRGWRAGPAQEPVGHGRGSSRSSSEYNIVLAAASGPQDFLAAWSAAEPERLMLAPIFPCIDGKNPVFFRHDCFADGGDFPDIDWLEAQYESGTYQLMGEMYNQYAGIPFDDPRMDPYYALAERLGIPVAFHTHSGRR